MSDFSAVKKILSEGFEFKKQWDICIIEEENLKKKLCEQFSDRLIKDIRLEELTEVEKAEHLQRIELKNKLLIKINNIRPRLFALLLEDKVKACFTEETRQIFLKMRSLLERDRIDLIALFLKIWSFTGDLSKYTKKIDQEYLLLINTPEKKSICMLIQKIFFDWDNVGFDRFCKAENIRKMLKDTRCDLKEILECLNHDLSSEDINRVVVGLEPKILETMLVLSATLPLPFQPNLEVVSVLSKNLSIENIETVLKILLSSSEVNVEVLEKIRDEMSPRQQENALNLAITQTREPSVMFINTFSSGPYVEVAPACQKLLLLSTPSPQMQTAKEILLHKQDAVKKRFSFNPDEIKFYSKIISLKEATSKIDLDFSEIEGIIDTLPIAVRESFLKKEIKSISPNNKILNILIHYVTPEFRNVMIENFKPAFLQEMLIFSGTLPFIPDTGVVEALSNRLSIEQKEAVIKIIVSQVTPNPEVIKILTSDDNVKTDAALHKVLLQSRPNMKAAKALYRRASDSFKEKNGVRYEALLKQYGENSIDSPIHVFRRLAL